MKIYIHTDLEGISGIDSVDLMERDSACHRCAIERLMMDINAAIEGAFAGGATHITVLDSHGGGGNFDLSLLDPRVEYDTKENGKWWGKLDDSYQGTFFIGAHAMAGTINGFLDHTQSSTAWFQYSGNDQPMGELAQWAMVAAHFQVPLLMVSGDEAACVEARQFFSPLQTAIVKRGVGRNRAELVDLNDACNRIKDAATKAMSLIGQAKPFAPNLPLKVKLVLNRSDYADALAKKPGIERLDARTVVKTAQTYLDCLL